MVPAGKRDNRRQKKYNQPDDTANYRKGDKSQFVICHWSKID